MASSTARLLLIGGGNMGSAIVGGLIAAGWKPSSIVVVELDAQKRSMLESEFGVLTSEVIVSGEGALIAVKPNDAVAVCAQVAALGVKKVVSIAAGISVSTLQDAAGEHTHVIRAMPNTPALVREGVTAISGSALCEESDYVWAEELLRAVGVVVRVPEHHMDLVTAVAGSGPGYIFLIAEALLGAAIAQGLPNDVANVLVRQLFRGAGILLEESFDSPATLREKVTSPNGTTAAGLQVLEDSGIREILHNVVHAAVLRSVEMGK